MLMLLLFIEWLLGGGPSIQACNPPALAVGSALRPCQRVSGQSLPSVSLPDFSDILRDFTQSLFRFVLDKSNSSVHVSRTYLAPPTPAPDS